MAILLAFLLQFSGTGRFVPGAGGLNGWQRNNPVISAASASPSATTVVLGWTTDIASDSRAHCGSEEAVDSGVAGANTSHQVIVAGLVASTGYSCTIQSGNTTQTVAATTSAAASSTPITSVSFGSSTNYNTASPPHTMVGDTFYNCKSNDGTTYVTTDDTTTGWDGLGISASIMLAKFSSLSPITGTDVNGLSGYGGVAHNTGNLFGSPKLNGLFCMSSKLFIALTNQQFGSPSFPQYFGSIITSADHGATWNNMQTPTTTYANGQPMSPYSITLWPGTSPSSFASSAFVMYGADDGTLGYTVAANRVDNGDAYVYGISNSYGTIGAAWNNGDAYYLWRVPRARLANLHASDYQFYVSGDGSLDSAWSSSQSSATALVSNSGQLSIANIQYIPALNRYLLLTYYYPGGVATSSSHSVWLAYESPHPWGAWTLIGTIDHATTGDYNPVILQSDALAATLGSTTMRVLWTQDFRGANYNLFYATMTVGH